MNKTVLTICFSVSVLIAGLPSCSPDRQTTSPYQATAPHIRRTEGNLDLKTWDHSNQHELDLEDVIDLSETRAALAKTRMRCQLGDRSYEKESEQKSPREIKVMELVPQNLLTADLEAQMVLCSADLILANSEGSRHIFSFTNFRLRGQSPSGVELEQNQRVASDRMWLQFNAAISARARFRNQAPAKALILCSSRVFDELTFEQLIDLGHFDFSRPHAIEDRQPDVTELCRLEVRENGRLSALSPLFVFWRPPTLSVEIDEKFNSEATKKYLFFYGQSFEFRKIHVTNKETRSLSFSFPSTLVQSMDVFYSGKAEREARTSHVNFKITGLKDAESHVERGLTFVKIKPGGEVILTLVALPEGFVKDNGSVILRGARICLDQPQRIKFFEEGIPDQPMSLGASTSLVNPSLIQIDQLSPDQSCPR